MKKFLISIALAFGLLQIAFGQPNTHLPSPTYRDIQDSNYRYLDKSRITSGVLLDRVKNWVDYSTLDGTKSITTTQVSQVWHELQLASYTPTTAAGIDRLRVLRNYHKEEGVITIGYIHMEYQQIDSAALKNGALTISPQDSLLRDGNLSISPYIANRILLPMINAEKWDAKPYQFYFHPELTLYNKQLGNVSTITLSINGSTITLSPGSKQKLDLSGLAAGKHTLKTSIKVSTGTTFIYDYELLIPSTVVTMSSVTTDICFSDELPTEFYSGSLLKFQGYDETVPSQGKGQFKIWYKISNISGTPCVRKLTKPIILVDAFDPENKRKVNMLWDELSYGTKHLGDSLRLKGFDVVVLDFPTYASLETGDSIDGGADYIERNAMTLVKLIQNLHDSMNNNGVSDANREVVIVGPSMGGQISRYALAFMEKQHSLGVPKMQHKCRLWMSFDSPHRGANIPMSTQLCLYWFGHHANNVPALNSYNAQLRNKAARQQLIDQVDGTNRTATFHSTYYNSLNNNGLALSNGYPMNLRKVALINGANNGTKNNTPGSNALTGDATGDLGVNGLDMYLYNAPETGSYESFKGMVRNSKTLPLSSTFLGSTYSYNTSDFLISGIYQDISFTRTYIGLVYAKRVDTYRGTYTVNLTKSEGSLDATPGGIFKALQEIKSKFKNVLDTAAGVDTYWIYINTPQQTFIPSISALGFKNFNFHWANRFDNRNLVCTGEIPFDGYFAPKQNEDHVTITEENAPWIIDEVMYGQQGCPNICSEKILRQDSVNPLNHLCPNTEYTFTLDELIPAGATAQWSASSGITFPYGSTGNTVKIKYTGTVSPSLENSFIQVVITPKIGTSQCGAKKTIRQKINYGNIFQAVVTEWGTPVFKVDIQPKLDNNTYQWDINNEGNWSTLPNTTNDWKSFDKIHVSDSPKLFSVRINNSTCSTFSETITKPYLVLPTSGSGAMYRPTVNDNTEITVIPNPTDNNWTLSIPNNWDDKTLINYFITTVDGKILISNTTSYQSSISIDGSNLSRGVYVLKISNGSKSESVKLVKQ